MNNDVIDLIRRVGQICLLRAGPEDLPASRLLTVQVFLALGLALAVMRLLIPTPAGAPGLAAVVLLALGSTALWPWLMLHLRQRPERFMQTVTGFAGASLVFALLAAPFQWWATRLIPVGVSPEQVEPSMALGMATIGLLVLLVWKIRVDGHLWSRALDIGPLPGLVLAIAFAVVEILLLNALPAAVATAPGAPA